MNSLGVPVDFFSRADTPSLASVDFRKHHRLPVKEQEKIRQHTLDFLERYIEIENILGVDKAFKDPLKGLSVSSRSDPAAVADHLQKIWNLGIDPLGNTVDLLENNGIKVLQIDGHDAFLGLSTFVNGKIPVIVLNNNRSISLVDKRFTALQSDQSVIYIATSRDGMVLTGDNLMRKTCELPDLTVHGSLWLLDQWVILGVYSQEEAWR